MTEELIEEARDMVLYARAYRHGAVSHADMIDRLADALEAATVEPEWEYGMQDDLGLSFFSTSQEAELHAGFQDPALNPHPVRRRAAGPWLPVGGESNAE